MRAEDGSPILPTVMILLETTWKKDEKEGITKYRPEDVGELCRQRSLSRTRATLHNVLFVHLCTVVDAIGRINDLEVIFPIIINRRLEQAESHPDSAKA